MQTIPLFPLHSVLFPGTPLHLHVFEARYRTMVQMCLEQRLPIGIVLIRHGEEAGDTLVEPHPVGCSAEIIHSQELADGRFNLVVLGIERFRIIAIHYDQPYLTADVESTPLAMPQTVEIHRGIRLLEQKLRCYLQLIEKISSDPVVLHEAPFPTDPLPFLYLACAILQIPHTEKQTLLESLSAGYLLQQLRRLYARELVILPETSNQPNANRQRAAWLN